MSTPFSSELVLFNNLRMDSAGEHTLYFANKTDQLYWFQIVKQDSIQQHIYSQSYIRPERPIKIEFPTSDVENVNYCMFRNPGHEDRWYYAFVTKINYISDSTTELLIKIDPMQTWLGEYTLGECFVEREHTDDDTQPSFTEENLEYGEYFTRAAFGANINRDGQIMVVAASVDSTGEDAEGKKYAGVYSGLQLIPFSSVENLNTWIKSATDANKRDSILAIFMMPSRMFSNTEEQITFNVDVPVNFEFGGYTPKNNKLYMHPYNVLTVHNMQGASADFRYEYFTKVLTAEGKRCRFIVRGITTANPKIFCYPQGYQGEDNAYTHGITIEGFPQCAFTTDTYRAYLAQNANMLPLSIRTQEINRSMGLARGAAQAGASLLTGNLGMAAGAGVGMIETAVSSQLAIDAIMAKKADVSTLPPQAHGSSGSDVMYSSNLLDFVFFSKSISPYYAQQIDNYFTRYGYRANAIKVPNTHQRAYWCFTKTQGCTAFGNVPQEWLDKIKARFDAGVTHWKNGDMIGNYTLDNVCVGNG